jgi:hypothetical protein
MKMKSRSKLRPTVRSAIALTTLGVLSGVQAGEIDLGNPDLKVLWGNTVRYNLGVRAEKQDFGLARLASVDESDASFDRGRVSINRLDLLSELDLSYKSRYGARLSAALWYDAAFNKTVKTGPGLETRGSYDNNQFSSYTKRYHGGPSGEILDAYVFGNFDLGSLPANLKVGRQTNLWGEAIVNSAHSVSYAQSPSDGLKALISPGADAKELALPVGQVYASLQVSESLSLAAQYFFEWKETRIAQGGTYSAIYPENAKLAGLSYATSVAGASIGAEIVRRQNTALASSITDGATVGARGNTWHALVNAIKIFGPAMSWDQAVLTAELGYSRLDKVTSGQAYFNGCVRPNLPTRTEETGCASKENWVASLRFSPSWAALFGAGWDLAATAAVNYGIKGNSAVLGGGSEKAGNWTIGTTLTYNQTHDFTIAYTDYLATHVKNPATGLITASNGSQLQDRGWLSFTYKASF